MIEGPKIVGKPTPELNSSIDNLDVSIRIISTRKATRKEIRQYEELNP